MKSKRIALVYDAIYPYIKGGGEKRFYEIALRLTKSGHDVHLYGMKLWDGPDVIVKNGVHLHGLCMAKPLYTKTGRRSISQALYFGIACMKLIGEDFDVIDCCGFPYFSLFSTKLVCLLKGKKLYSTWHEVWGKEYGKKYLGSLWFFGYLIESLAAKLPNRIIAVSDSTAKRIVKELGYTGDISVIPNGVDLEEIQKVKPSKTKSDLIYAGRLMDFKNIDVLIRAVGILKTKLPTIKCVIVGDGPERNKLEALSETLHLSKNVVFIGFLPKHEDVYALIKSSKVFVLPSSREGFGISVIEANACGIPVLTTNDQNNYSKDLIIDGQNGYICNLNINTIAQKNLQMFKQNKNYSKYLAYTKKFDMRYVLNKLKSAYQL